MPKVLISDKLSPAAVKIFEDRGIEVDVKPGLDKDELAKIIGDYDGLAIRSATKVTPPLIEAAKNSTGSFSNRFCMAARTDDAISSIWLLTSKGSSF